MDIRTNLRNFVKESLAEHGYHDEFSDQESLVISGLMDSLAIINIVVFLEQEYNIDFFDFYFDQNNFDSIDLLVQFIEEHCK
jgi:methoxymalonate biosynthesis acyl carrier protein